MVGWHHRPNGHEFEQTLEDSKGQGSLQCYSPWDFPELDMTQQLNNNIQRKQVQCKKQQLLFNPPPLEGGCCEKALSLKVTKNSKIAWIAMAYVV